jgi:hypothetical protein
MIGAAVYSDRREKKKLHFGLPFFSERRLLSAGT